MLSTPDFLRRLHCTKGTLLLFLLSSWREVADSSGMHGADVLSSLFDAVCRNATEGTSTRARLDTTVFASFWTDGDDVLASQKLDGLLRW